MKTAAAAMALLLLLTGCSGKGAIGQAFPFETGPSGVSGPPADVKKARKSIETAAAALEELGVEGAAETGTELAESLDGASGEEAEWYASWYAEPSAAAAAILMELGCGEWDENTWEWSPTSHQVYWFDAEVMNLDVMYTETLAGIQSITAEDASFTDIAEDVSGVDYEADSGTQTITFRCNGEPCRYDAEFQGDWLDEGFLVYMGKVLDRLESEKCLYACFDGGQGYMLMWQTPAWAAKLQKATGLELTPAAGGLSSGWDLWSVL